MGFLSLERVKLAIGSVVSRVFLLISGHKGAVWATRISLDASLSVTGSADFSAKLWDNNTGQDTCTFQHDHIVRCVDISGGQEKIVKVFDLRQDNSKITQPIRSLCVGSTIKTALLDAFHGLVFVGDGKDLRVFDLRTTEQSAIISYEAEITDIKFSWDRKTILISTGKNVHFHHAITSNLIKTITVDTVVSSAALHPTHPLFIVGSTSDLWARVYDYNTVLKGHHGPVHCVQYGPDGMLAASGSEDGVVRLWQTFPGTLCIARWVHLPEENERTSKWPFSNVNPLVFVDC